MHVSGPGDDDHDFFLQGPVVGLLVDDFAATRAAMVDAGIRFIGELRTAGGAAQSGTTTPPPMATNTRSCRG